MYYNTRKLVNEKKETRMEGFFYRAGSVPGSMHRLKNINNQDSFCVRESVINETQYLYGVVCDGCTGRRRSRNEVGALLLSQFICSEIPFILASHTALPYVPDILYNRVVGYLGSIMRSTVMGSPETLWLFIETHLLTTAVGFILDSRTLVTFSAGDGIIFTNDFHKIISQNNRPFYPAYHLVDRAILGDVAQELPDSFETSVLHGVSVPQKFAICTDGISQELERDPEFFQQLPCIWEYESAAKAGLQWWLNGESRESGRFSDDCTVISVKKIVESEAKAA